MKATDSRACCQAGEGRNIRTVQPRRKWLFVEAQLAATSGLADWSLLSQQIKARFETQVHPRSVERAVKRKKKPETMTATNRTDTSDPAVATQQYESLRANALGEINRAPKLTLFLRDGMKRLGYVRLGTTTRAAVRYAGNHRRSSPGRRRTGRGQSWSLF